MGLVVSEMARFPTGGKLDYYVYFLDYGWDDNLSRAMYQNFDAFAGFTHNNNSVVVRGLNRRHFSNEVLSWYHVNGRPVDTILPAILITDLDPRELGRTDKMERGKLTTAAVDPMRLVLIPLRELCKTESDVTSLLQDLAKDMEEKRSLSKFKVRDLLDRSNEGLADVLILKPSIGGIGIDLRKFFEFGSKYFKKRIAGSGQ